MKHSVRAAIALCALSFSMAMSAQTSIVSPVDFEDLDKTLSSLESAFAHGNVETLRAVSTQAFQKSPFYEHLRESLGELQLASGQSSQVAEQTFTLEPGRAEITVTFRLSDGRWLLKDMRSAQSHRPDAEGMSFLAREYYFSDFRAWIEAGGLSRFPAFAAYTQLMTLANKGKTLSARSETKVTVTNLILHDGKRAHELIYVIALKSDKIEGTSRGWLIDEAGSMLDFEEANGGNRLLLQFLSGAHDAIDLNRKSAFMFRNVEANAKPTLPVTHVDYQVTKVATSGFRWTDDRVRFEITIDCVGASWEPPLTVRLEDNRVVLDTQSDARFVGSPASHRYLNAVTTVDGELIISLKDDVLARPIRSFALANVLHHSARRTEGGIRIVIEVEGPSMVHNE